jgi:ABC-type ATPase with predicted acetyltransferase domain
MAEIIDSSECIVTRDANAGKHNLSLLKNIRVEFGEKSDWEDLCELHYKGHSLAAGSRFMRCVHEENGVRTLIGVMVFANPMPLNKGRNVVFPKLKPNQDGGRDTTMMNKRRMEHINRFMTWNNRTVLDTMYRSAGIAYRFKNLAYRIYCTHYGYQVVESNSSMGRFNPFSIKAGMSFIKPRPANALEVGIDFFKHHFVSHPCDQAAILQELRSMPEGVRKVIEQKLRVFYQKNSSMEKSGDKMHLGMARVDQLDIEYILKQTTQIVFGATIYWVWKNPDFGRELPKSLPLLAFDNQGPNEPLNLEKLALMEAV